MKKPTDLWTLSFVPAPRGQSDDQTMGNRVKRLLKYALRCLGMRCVKVSGGPICRVCGCTEFDCSGCVKRTGRPCHWVERDLCSACVEMTET